MALSVLTRYAAVFLIPAVFLYLVSLRHYRPALVFGAVSSVAFLWMGRNYLLTHTLMGPRIPATLSWIGALRDIVTLSLEWLVQFGVIYALASFVYVLLLRDYVVQHRDSVDQRREVFQRTAAAVDGPTTDNRS